MPYERQVAEIIAGEHENGGPGDAAGYVVCKKPVIFHPSDAGHKWHEGSNDGNETCQDDGFPAVPLIEFMRPVKVLFVEKVDILFMKNFRADVMPDPIIDVVSAYGGRGEDDYDEPYVKDPNGGERPGCEEQRISRQKRGDHEAGFAKDNHKKDQVRPYTEAFYYHAQVFVDVEDKIY